jgi:small-conductance mechanosensitive channel
MLDVILVFLALIVALVLRAEPLRRLRTLTLPLVLTAVAALAHLVANSLSIDEGLIRWTQVVLVLALGFLVARGCLILVFDWVLVRRMGVTPPRLMREVVALLAYLALAAIILRTMDVEVGGLITTSAVITVVVGLALQQTLGNLLAGLALAWEQRLKIGTWVELDGAVGIIEQTGWRSLVARTRRGERVLVPNSDVASARVTILGSGQHPVAVAIRLGVGYGVPPDAAKEVLRHVAADIPGVLATPPPKILTHDFADSAVLYECRLWTVTPWCRDDLTDEFLTRAHAALKRAGMEIPFPQRTLHRPRLQQTGETIERRQSILAESLVFGELPEEATFTLAENSRLRRYAPGEAVLRAGEESTALYLVAEGEAVVEHKSREFARIGKGDVFGEMAFFTGERRTATVRASGSPLEVIEVDDASMRSLLEHHPGIADHLAEKMAARRLQGEELRDESGALISPAGLVAQFRKHLLKIMGR